MTRTYDDLPTTVCSDTQTAAQTLLDDLASVPDLAQVPAYRDLIEQLYLVTRAAATLAAVLGDPETARANHEIAEELVRVANL